MRRRALIAGSGTAAIVSIAPASAQRGATTIGVLVTSTAPNLRAETDALAAELAARGWAGARAARVVIASAEDDAARLPELARLMIAAAPEVIVAGLVGGGGLALAAATSTIPIVLVDGGDFEALGLTTSLARPSRNVTGFGSLDDVLEAKRLDLLLQVAPASRRVGFIWNPNTARGGAARAQIEAAAASRGVAAAPLPAGSDAEMLTVFDRAAAAGVEALVVVSDPVVGSNIDYIVERTTALRLPAVYGYATFARHGGLVTYAVDPIANWRAAARYVDRLLRGAKVAELPFQAPARIALTLNLPTARKMGLEFPPALLASADEVIE